MSKQSHRAPELSGALAACRGAFVAVGSFTGFINILTLTGSFFMLQVYDRVLPSRSIPTLVALAGLVAALYAIQGLLEALRSGLLVRIGRTLDARLSSQVYQGVARLPLKTASAGDGLQPVRDLDQVRSFLSSPGPTALFDLPWMPLYLGLCFAFHVLIGLAALAGAIILIALTLLTEAMTRKPSQEASVHGAKRLVHADASRRNAEVIAAMGMTGRLSGAWDEINAKYMESQQAVSDVAGRLGSASRIMRMFLQSGVLAVGAYLVINQEATGGIIIASSILVSRALAPVEIAIANWRGFLGARQSWARLSDLMRALQSNTEPMQLPAPKALLSVESISVAPPGLSRAVVQDASFQLKAGQGLGVIGPSASGKSSLARALVGVWAPARGKVRLDGAALEQWPSDELGPHVGYLPQDVGLFGGSIAQNIARFEESFSPDDVIAAAQAAGVHELILRLPDGYGFQVGDFGTALSAGQRQRVALARALYKNPFLVVLDEPNSNLDAEGDNALTQAILGVRKRGGVAVVIAHRPSALLGVDHVLAMANGQIQAFGPKDEVMRKVLDSQKGVQRPVRVVGDVAAAGAQE